MWACGVRVGKSTTQGGPSVAQLPPTGTCRVNARAARLLHPEPLAGPLHECRMVSSQEGRGIAHRCVWGPLEGRGLRCCARQPGKQKKWARLTQPRPTLSGQRALPRCADRDCTITSTVQRSAGQGRAGQGRALCTPGLGDDMDLLLENYKTQHQTSYPSCALHH